MTEPIVRNLAEEERRSKEMEALGDKIVQSQQELSDKMVEASQASADIANIQALRNNELLAMARTVAEVAAVTTAKATEEIRKLTVVTVCIGATTLAYILVFSVMFWKYAIILRTP